MNSPKIILFLALASNLYSYAAWAEKKNAVSPQPRYENTKNVDISNAQTLPSFTIKQIKVVGNTVLDEEINRLISSYIGRKADFNLLTELKDKISNLYIQNGYLNSGAYLAPQSIENGIVKFNIIEGTIEKINVSGNDRISNGYIQSRLGDLKTPVSSSQLLDKLYLLRQDPLIESLSAELATGTKPGTSVLEVDVTEAKAFKVELGANNHKSPAIGQFARWSNLTHNNLLGFGDRASFKYTNTKGSNTVDLNYSVPITSKDTRLSVAYGLGKNEVVEEVFTDLDIQSKADYWQVNLTHPVIAKSNRQLSLGLAFSRQHSETTLLDDPFTLSRGSDNEGNTNVSALRFSTNYLERKRDSVLAASSQFSAGLDTLGATISDDDDVADAQFLSWRGQVQYVQNLAEDFPIVFNSQLQLATDPLVPFEQFRVGGAGTVRGYRQDLALGDNGLAISVETRIPVWRNRASDVLLQISPFFDYGTAWNQDDLEVSYSNIASAGVGLNLTISDRLSSRLDWAVPFTKTEVDGTPFSFNLSYTF